MSVIPLSASSHHTHDGGLNKVGLQSTQSDTGRHHSHSRSWNLCLHVDLWPLGVGRTAYLDEAYSLSATAKEITNPKKDLIVATDSKNQIIGFVLLTRGTTDPCLEGLNKTIELQRLYVHPQAHGGGVGKLLAKHVEEMARKQGFENLWLGVWEENVKARKIYEKLGFTKVGSHNFKTGQVVQTDFIMAKRL